MRLWLAILVTPTLQLHPAHIHVCISIMQFEGAGGFVNSEGTTNTL